MLDDDLTNVIDRISDHDLTQLHQITNWLMTQFERNIAAVKEIRPIKAKRANQPHVIWMAPPTHCHFGEFNNAQREFQTEILQEIIRTKKYMTVLKLVKVWNHDDTSLFLCDSYRFTSEGLIKYWQSIDCAVKFWFAALSQKKDGALTQRPKGRFTKDKFHWHHRFHHKSSHCLKSPSHNY